MLNNRQVRSLSKPSDKYLEVIIVPLLNQRFLRIIIYKRSVFKGLTLMTVIFDGCWGYCQ